MPTSKNSIYLIIYGVIGAIQITGEFLELELLSDAAKSALMPTLAIFLWKSAMGSRLKSLVFLALFFSWMGDLLLINGSDEFYFLLGIFSFFLAHAFYIAAFYQTGANWQESKPIKVLVISVSLGGAFLNYYQLLPGLGEMSQYVLAYTVIIIAMLIFSVLRFGGTGRESAVSVFFGAVLFVLSDSLIGYSRFVSPIQYGHCYVMLTYILAQGAIVYGLVRHKPIL